MRRSHLANVAIAALVGVSATVTAIVVATPASAAPARSIWGIPGRGATVPFVEHEAEYAATNGTLIGPDRRYTTLPSEASGRQAVTLDAVGEYVEFTLNASANAMVFRYSIPDSANGAGRDATIDVRVNGTVLKTVPITSKYGWYYGGYPFNNNPGDTNPHHFYDEARTLFGQTYPAGTKIRLQVNSTAQSPTFTIDLADFENVPAPIAKPAGAIDVVTDFGADPTGGSADQTAKFQAAVNAGQAQGRVVWIPQGRYTLWDHVIVDGVTLRGAGMWYSELTGRHPTDRSKAVGVYGKYVPDGGPSRNVNLRDFAIIGDIREREDNHQVNAIGGAMTDSVIENIWMENTKCGAWMDGPMNNLVIRNSRIIDQIADGVNFHIGVTNSRVTNTFVRNTGDDGLAMWAERVPNVANSFDHNTVAVTILANNIVTYGGRDIQITDNVTSDSLTNGGGIHVANRYPGVNGPTAVQGVINVARNTLIRNGNSDYNWQFGVGAIWFSGLNEPINATINVTDTNIYESSYAALMWIEGSTRTVNFTNVRIENTGTYALQIQAPGAATFNNVVATGIAQAPDNLIHNCVGTGFQITQGTGNSGWYDPTPYCGPWHEPNWGNPVPPTSTSPPPTTSSPSPPPDPGGNLAAGRPSTSSSNNQSYVSGNAFDGNASSYWESANSAFPQWIQVDLGAARNIDRVVLKLPPSWEPRTQTIAVLDGANQSVISAAAGRNFSPNATITFSPRSVRYVRLQITGNTGWPAGQLSEFEVYGGSAPSGPQIGLSAGSLAFGNQTVNTTSGAQTVTVSNSGTGSATLGAVNISGDFARTTTCGSTLAAGGSCAINVTFRPTVAGPRSGSVSFTSNAAGSPHTVSLSGNGVTAANPNLALNRPTSASSHTQTYVPANVVDANAGTYWESANNAFPQWIQVDLGAAVPVSRLVLKLPASWGPRTQTIAVLDGSNQSVISAAAGRSFSPNATITFGSRTVRYLRLQITGNTGWPAGQLSELEVYAS